MYQYDYDALTIHCAGHLLSNFTYNVKESSVDSRFKEVSCDYIYDDYNLSLFIFFPSDLYDKDSIFIAKAKEFVNAIINNREINVYSDRLLAFKPHTFITPLPFKAFIVFKKLEAKKQEERMAKAKQLKIEKEKQAKIAEKLKAKEIQKNSRKGLFAWFKNLKPGGRVAVIATSVAVVSSIAVGILYSAGIFNRPVVEPTYEISIDCGDGSIGGEHILKLNGKTVIETAPNPKRDGYTLEGWYKKKELSNSTTNDYVYKDKISFPYQLTENSTMYAKWDLITSVKYEITFESNGGSSINPLKVPINQPISSVATSGKLETPTKAGFEFEDWYYDNETFKNKVNLSDCVTKDFKVYAKYKQTAWKITYVTEGSAPEGTTDIGNNRYISNDYIKVIENEPTSSLTGKVFKGWKDKNGFIAYPFKVEGDTTLEAVFADKCDSYTVKFFDEDKSTIIKQFDECTYISNPPTASKEHKKFDAWVDEAGNKVNFYPRYNITKDTNFYATYTDEEFPTMFYGIKNDDSSNPVKLIESENYVASITKVPSYSLDDYAFETDSSGNCQWYIKNEKEELVKVEDITKYVLQKEKNDFYCKYNRNAFTVEFVDGETSKLKLDHVVELDVKGQSPQLSKTGYTLSWIISYTDGSGVTHEEDVTDTTFELSKKLNYIKSNKLTVKAKWSQQYYTLTVYDELDGKKIVGSEKCNIDSEGKASIALSELEKYKNTSTTYTFKNWADSAGTAITSDTFTFNSDTSIYAKYELLSYHVTIKYVDGIDYDTDLKTPYLVELNKGEHTTSELLKDDAIGTYKFSHWEYANKQKFTSDTFQVASDITLYAVYSQSYNVKAIFKFENESSTTTIDYGNMVSVTPSKLKTPQLKEDYEDVEWYNDASFTEKIENPETEISLSSDKTFYSKIVKSGFTATFYTLNASTGAEEQYNEIKHLKKGEVLKSDRVKNPLDDTRKFSAWTYTNDKGETVPADFVNGFTISKDIKFVASYDKTTKITFTFRSADKYDKDSKPNGARFVGNDSSIVTSATFETTSTHTQVESSDYSLVGNKSYGVVYDEVSGGKGHALSGWYKDEACTQPANFPISDGGIYSVYAKFEDTSTNCSLQLNAGNGEFGEGTGVKLKNLTTTVGTTVAEAVKDVKSQLYLYGYQFDSWTCYDAATGKEEKISDDFKLQGNMLLTASYTETIETEEKSFAEASWARIDYDIKNLTQSEFRTKYSSSASLSGKTKTVTYNSSVVATATVLDENHDTITDSSDKAALTMQFTKMPDTSIFHPSIHCSFTNNRWELSDLRASANSGEIYEKFPLSFRNHLVSVDKETMKGGNGSDYTTLITTSDKFFTLSRKEVGLDVRSSSIAVNEGTSYLYYSNGGSKKLYYSGIATAYYLRTPLNSTFASGSGVLGWGVEVILKDGTAPSGTSGSDYWPDAVKGLAFGFCLGVYKTE